MTDNQSPLALLKSYAKVLCELSDLLSQEKTAIEQNKIDEFSVVVAQKEQKLNALSKIQEALHQLCQGKPVEAAILSMDKSDDTKQLLAQIKQYSHDCDTQSQVNGILIMASKQLTERLLDGITGRKRNQIYSKNGTETKIESSHHTRI